MREQIHKAGERAADLTQKLLTFSRKQKVNLKPLNLNLLVADTKKMFERLIGEVVSLDYATESRRGTSGGRSRPACIRCC